MQQNQKFETKAKWSMIKSIKGNFSFGERFSYIIVAVGESSSYAVPISGNWEFFFILFYCYGIRAILSQSSLILVFSLISLSDSPLDRSSELQFHLSEIEWFENGKTMCKSKEQRLTSEDGGYIVLCWWHWF